jgi:hypothetical protein
MIILKKSMNFERIERERNYFVIELRILELKMKKRW